MPEELRVGPLLIPGDELTERFSRASGPGGQGVNTTDSRVQLRWNVAESSAVTQAQRARLLRRLDRRLVGGVLIVVAAEHRSQHLNRAAARERLAELVADALRPPAPPRRPTRPSAAARERRIESKHRRSDVKRQRREPGPDES